MGGSERETERCRETISQRQTVNEEKKRERERERFRKEEICKDKRWNKVTQRHKERKVLT